MVLVAVRQQHPAEAVAPGEGVGEVRDHVVDAGQLVVGEHEATVDGEQVVAALDEHHVEADLAEPAQGNEAHRGFHEDSFPDRRFIVPLGIPVPKFTPGRGEVIAAGVARRADGAS